MMATEKQINYIMALARKNNMSTDWMNSTWKRFATMRERSGRVRDFLASIDRSRASEIIDALK